MTEEVEKYFIVASEGKKETFRARWEKSSKYLSFGGGNQWWSIAAEDLGVVVELLTRMEEIIKEENKNG